MKVVAVAGKFDPLHEGHRQHMRAASELGDWLVVITHPDEIVAMSSRKGFCCQSLGERIRRLCELPYVDRVVVSIDKDGTVADTLNIIRPNIFAKGGDRTPDNMPENEIDVCRRIRCEIVYGVGGEKIDSSSSIVEEIVRAVQD